MVILEYKIHATTNRKRCVKMIRYDMNRGEVAAHGQMGSTV